MSTPLPDSRSREEVEILLSPRDTPSESSFDVDPIPVVCTPKDSSSQERIPAVRACHPSLGFVLFPLNRIELGEVWFGTSRIKRWNIKPVDGGWDEATSCFKSLIKYPPEFLTPLLNVLRSQALLDGSPLSWTHWSSSCKNTSTQLYASADCHLCGNHRRLSMRLLNEVGRSLNDFQCATIGALCGVETEAIHYQYLDLPPVNDSRRSPTITPIPPKIPYPPASRYQLPSSPNPLYPNVKPTISTRPSFYPPTRPTFNHLQPDPSDPALQAYTWSDIKGKVKEGSRHRLYSPDEYDDEEDHGDPRFDTFAIPQPKNFIHGTLVKRLRKPDPTPFRLEEYWALKTTKEWRETKHSFIKWINANKDLRFTGTQSVALFIEWNQNIRTHFKDCDIHNPICQSEVATATFTKNARNWWDAHTLKHPRLLVTYEQLLEWMRHELVPDSNPALAYMEWGTLRFKGNIQDYMRQVDRLMEYFPIQRDTMIACLANPISPEFAAELRNMDIRLEGMSDPKLKEVIRNHLISTRAHHPTRYSTQDRYPRNDPDKRSYPPTPAKHDACLYAAPREPLKSSPSASPPANLPPPLAKPAPPSTKPFPKAPADPLHTYIAAKYGDGPTPCYVCGKRDHGWVQCQKKKRGKCGVCGSEAHWTRHC